VIRIAQSAGKPLDRSSLPIPYQAFFCGVINECAAFALTNQCVDLV